MLASTPCASSGDALLPCMQGAGEAAQDAGVEEVPAEAEPTGEDVGPAQLEEEYDYEHFWDHAAAEDAPPEDELEHALEHARSKFSEQVCSPIHPLLNPNPSHRRKHTFRFRYVTYCTAKPDARSFHLSHPAMQQ